MTSEHLLGSERLSLTFKTLWRFGPAIWKVKMSQARKGKGCMAGVLAAVRGRPDTRERRESSLRKRLVSPSPLHLPFITLNIDPQCFLQRPHCAPCAFCQYMLCFCICSFLCSNIKVVKMNDQTVIISSRAQEAVKNYIGIARNGKTMPQWSNAVEHATCVSADCSQFNWCAAY